MSPLTVSLIKSDKARVGNGGGALRGIEVFFSTGALDDTDGSLLFPGKGVTLPMVWRNSFLSSSDIKSLDMIVFLSVRTEI